MRAPISFFDTTPMGRILNRFSQDLDQLDSFVFFFLEICVEHGLFALGILAVISYAIPQLTIFTVPVVAAVYLLQRFYSRSVCRLKRLSSVNRSPVFTHFSETVSGLGVIRAHGQQSRFILENQVKVDRFQNPASLAYAANKWMQFWLDMIGCFLLVVVSLYVILYREDVKPGLVGLSLSMVVAITVELKAMSQKSSELESSIVAVERILEYCTVPSEVALGEPRVAHPKPTHCRPPFSTSSFASPVEVFAQVWEHFMELVCSLSIKFF
ncbi:multidrug resistance-associated protein 1 [Plakobranchus ocellatus]|uniref:Multidrug resistance-associated protein 1 n=1 Tax=Plakobranchus ocellatus TaxID=259542 RepID=A0AAV3ZP15_9GAST|nr:multidrug resistance-associated protein 1 [Plakobranchus ocellatus]